MCHMACPPKKNTLRDTFFFFFLRDTFFCSGRVRQGISSEMRLKILALNISRKFCCISLDQTHVPKIFAE